MSWLDPIAKKVKRQVTRELRAEGRRFAEITARRWKEDAELLHPVYPYLMGVPAGFMPSAFVPKAVRTEIPSTERNKKMSFAGMSPEQAAKIDEDSSSISTVDDKVEVGKLRSLVVGTIKLHNRMTQLSAVTESEYLVTMRECPLLAGTAKSRRLQKRMRACAKRGFVAARDYRNFNRCQPHSRIYKFFRAMEKHFRELARWDFAKVARDVIERMSGQWCQSSNAGSAGTRTSQIRGRVCHGAITGISKCLMQVSSHKSFSMGPSRRGSG